MGIRQVLDSLNMKCIRGFLISLYHSEDAGRKPYDPVSMLKAQILKYLRRVPNDRRLALLLRWNRRLAGACGFKRKTPSHSLFTQFRNRLGRDRYDRVFSMLLEQLLKCGIIGGEVVAVDRTAIKDYSQRDLDSKRGKSDLDARVGRGKRGFLLGYKVHTACCTSSELPLSFTLEPCNRNEKPFIKPLLQKLKNLDVSFNTVLADAQYDSVKVRTTVKEYNAAPIIPYRKTPKLAKL